MGSCLGVSNRDSVRLDILGLCGSWAICVGNLVAIMSITSLKLTYSASSLSGAASQSASLLSSRGDLLLSVFVDSDQRERS